MLLMILFNGGQDIKKDDSNKQTASLKPQSNQVFVVHGHDNEMKETVARVLKKCRS